MTDGPEFEIIDEIEAKARELDNSRLLDVHRWSDHPEVDRLVAEIYDAFFRERKADIARKHLKVLLLDLYISWFDDPERYTAIHRNPNAYFAGSRYNELHISRKTIDVVDTLVAEGFLDQHKGFRDRETGIGRLTRVRPAAPLAECFKVAAFSTFDVANHQDRILIELRSDDADNANAPRRGLVEYEQTDDTLRMAEVLQRYNALLRHTFVDVPTLGAKADHADWFSTSQATKTVRRIFNRGQFDCGGRFYGGWWQNCPKEWRSRIFINDEPTTEIDFSGLHIVLLYASKGISYWAGDRAQGPYDLGQLQPFETAEQTRAAIKLLALMALNAKSRGDAFSAFRSAAKPGSDEKRMTNDQLDLLLAAFEKRHPDIADQLCSDAGIHLMATDSEITDIIIDRFTQRGVPVLTVHDSYIVPTGQEDRLVRAMQVAFEKVTGVPFGNPALGVKEVSDRPGDMWDFLIANWQPYEGYDLKREGDEYRNRVDPKRTARYRHTLAAFKEWLTGHEGRRGDREG